MLFRVWWSEKFSLIREYVDGDLHEEKGWAILRSGGRAFQAEGGNHLACPGNSKGLRSFCVKQPWHLYMTLHLFTLPGSFVTPTLPPPLPDSFLYNKIPMFPSIRRLTHFISFVKLLHDIFFFLQHTTPPFSSGSCFSSLIWWHTIPTQKISSEVNI